MTRRPARPRPPSEVRRSSRAHEAVLDAATELFEELGYQRLTIDGIAARAGVSKATIYRWWPGRAAIVLEAFLTAVQDDIAYPDTGSVREDLIDQLVSLGRTLGQTRPGRMAITLLGEAQHDPELADAFRAGWLAPRRDAGRRVLRRGIERSELRTDLDLELALDGLYGPLYLRLLFGHSSLDRDSLKCLVDQVLQGIALRSGDDRPSGTGGQPATAD